MIRSPTSRKRVAVAVTVVALSLVFVLAVTVAGTAAVQAALLVDEQPAPTFGTATSADLDALYRSLLVGASVAVVALIAAVTLIVIAANTRARDNARHPAEPPVRRR